MSAHCYDLQMEALRKVCQKQLIGSMTAEAVAECSAAADSILDNQLQSTCKAFMTHPLNRCGVPCYHQSAMIAMVSLAGSQQGVLLYVVNLYHSVL